MSTNFKFFFFTGITCLILLNSCTVPIVDNPSQENGRFSCSINMTTAPAEVKRLDGTLFRQGVDTIHFDFVITGDSAKALVEDVSCGQWSVKINAYNDSNNVIYSGQTKVVVQPSIITTVIIHLNSTSSTGGINFIVTWGDQNDSTYFEVIATELWPTTNVVVNPGDSVKIEVMNGQWKMNPAHNYYYQGEGYNKIAIDVYQLPGVNEGSLIASMGDSLVTYVGNKAVLGNPFSTAVPLKLMINDAVNTGLGLTDNIGSLIVKITKLDK